MNVEQMVAALEQRVTALEGETHDLNQARLGRNSDAASVALRVGNQVRQEDQRRSSLIAEIATHEQRKKQLDSWKVEIDKRLAALTETPQPSHGIERDIWIRTHEELTETLAEIARGPGEYSSGYLREMAHRDGAPLLPGSISTNKLLTALRAELDAVAAS